MKNHAPVVAVLAFLIAGAAYTEAVPPWEAPDEPAHMAYVEILASGRLPRSDETYEYHQPPLYYAWPAFARRAAGAVPRSPKPTINPRYPFAAATYLHPPGDPAVAPLRLLRTFAGLLGALVVALTWATARGMQAAVVAGRPGSDEVSTTAERAGIEASRGPGGRIDPAFLAALCVALLPQFVFISHTLTNDTLAAVCGALVTYGLVRSVAPAASGGRKSALASMGHGDFARPSLCIGIGLALGLVTKLNVLPLALAVPIALALRAGADRHAGATPRAAARRVLSATALVAAPIAAAVLATVALLPGVAGSLLRSGADRGLIVRPELADPRLVAEQVMLMVASLWARFGWLSVGMPWWSYLFFGLALFVAAGGLLAAWRCAAARARRAYLILALSAAAVFATAVRSLLADPQPQGRLLFPALAAMAVLAVSGWAALFQGRASWRLWSAAVLAGLVATNLWVTGVLLPGAYRHARHAPPRVDTRLDVPLPPATLRLDAPAIARQTFQARQDGFRRIEFPVADAEAEAGQDARLFARVSDEQGSMLGSTSVALDELGPNAWIGVDVPPQPGSAGRSYALELVLSGSGRDRAGTLWLWRMPDGRGYPGGTLTLGGLTLDGKEGTGEAGTDLVFVTLLAGGG